MDKLKYLIQRFSGIRNRLLLQTVSITLFFISIIIMISSLFTGKLFIAKAKSDLVKAASTIESYNFYGNDFYKDIAQIESTNDLYIEIYLLPDMLIYTTRVNPSLYSYGENVDETEIEPKEKILRTVKMPEIIDQNSFFDIKQEINGSAKYIVYNKNLNDIFAIKIYDSLNVIESNAHMTHEYITFFCILFFIIIMFSLYLYENTMTRPLIKINRITKKIAALDFQEKCPDFRVTELKELSRNINHLSSALSMSLTDLQEKNRQLEEDIQKEQALDKMRAEFISNASHELKTPISIIQGYAEGLKIGVAHGEDCAEYCDIIMEESVKMNNLVLKLLEISQYESGTYKLKRQSFNIHYTVNSLLKPRVRLLKEKGITLSLNINPEYEGYADVSSFDTVLNNYVSNAVSHVKGEMLILITGKPVGEYYRISVFNTGDNISDDDIEKIWTSFYRADKSHSRAEGRFGLGLSFVKSIQELHSCQYGVINRPDGVEFWFDVKRQTDEE